MKTQREIEAAICEEVSRFVTVLMSWCRLKTLTPVICFDQVSPYLFEQVPSFFGRERLDQLLLGSRQNALEADQEKVTESGAHEMSLGPPAKRLCCLPNGFR